MIGNLKKLLAILGGEVTVLRTERDECDCPQYGKPGTEDTSGYTSLGGESGEESGGESDEESDEESDWETSGEE